MIESNFQIRIGIEIKRTDKKTFFKVSSLIWSSCSSVKSLEEVDASNSSGGLGTTVGGGGGGAGSGLELRQGW